MVSLQSLSTDLYLNILSYLDVSSAVKSFSVNHSCVLLMHSSKSWWLWAQKLHERTQRQQRLWDIDTLVSPCFLAAGRGSSQVHNAMKHFNEIRRQFVCDKVWMGTMSDGDDKEGKFDVRQFTPINGNLHQSAITALSRSQSLTTSFQELTTFATASSDDTCVVWRYNQSTTDYEDNTSTSLQPLMHIE